jgi:hypothetical protein
MLTAFAATAWMAIAAAPALAAAPANDDFEHAQPLGDVPAQTVGTRTEATRQANEPPGLQTVWYTLQPSRAGRIAIESESRGSIPIVAVFTGSSLTDLHALTRTEDANPYRVAFDAAAGQVYRIAVGSPYEGADPGFSLRVRPAPLPGNDAFEDAQRVAIPGVYEGNLADATGELGEPAQGQNVHSVWYRIKPRRTGRLTVEAAGDCSPELGIFTGSDVARLHKVGTAPGGVIRYVARRGRTYRISVTCRFPGRGDVSLTVSDGSVAGKGLTVSAPAGQTVSSVRSHGLRLLVGARRKVRISLVLTVSRKTARDLGLRSTELGRATGTLDYHDERPAAIRLTAAARRALRGETQLTARVRATILHSDAPNRVLTVPVTLQD